MATNEKNGPAPTPVAPTAGLVPIAGSAAARLTRQQRDALFEQAASGMTPEGHVESDDPLYQWTQQILKKHKEGFTARQILVMTRAPQINLNTSLRSIQRLISAHTKPKVAVAAAAPERA